MGGVASVHTFGGAHPVHMPVPGHPHGPVFIHGSHWGHCYGCRRFYGYGWYGYPGYGSYYYDPSWWWDSYSSYDPDQERERALASQMNELNLREQRLLQEEEAARARQAQGTDFRRAQEPQRGAEAKGEQPQQPTLLVFRDQHKREIQNYAIVDHTLWNLTPQRAEKIPLSELDLDATAKANEERGIEFQLPK